MDTRSSITQQRLRSRISAALSSAFSEWILILLLLIDSFSLYFATKLCRSCNLQTPCLLCSKFGHLFGKEKLGFYRDLVCDAHKLEISSFAFCHLHQKLANAREMCETCLVSFAKTMSSLETCNFLLSKLSMMGLDEDQILNTSSDEMVKLKLPLLKKTPEVGSPSTRPCSCCSQPLRSRTYPFFRLFQNKPLSGARRVGARGITENKPGDHSFDHLSCFRYKQLKFTSESEPEAFLSGDESRRRKACRKVGKETYLSSSCTDGLRKMAVSSDNIVSEKLIHPDPPVSVGCASVPKTPVDEDGFSDKSITDFNTTGRGHDWHPPATSETVSKPAPSGIPKELSEAVHVEIKKDSDLTCLTSKEDSSDLHHSSRANETQQTLASDIVPAREPSRLHEDLKQRLSQIPSPRWLQYPWTTDIKQHTRNNDDCKLFHSSSFHGMPSFNKRSDGDGGTVSEVEGEIPADRSLQRQIELDQKSLTMLYKELEEERNASAIAANQAMAMINKLQEEKATMQLEVMQYLRMMEEQTEYEQEAIRNLNDQLSEREKEIQDLEAELESCRKLARDEALRESFDSDESEYSTTSTPHVLKPRGRKMHHRPSVMLRDSAWYAPGLSKENLLEIEDERQYISRSLKRLEKSVSMLSNAGTAREDEDDEGFNEEIASPENHLKLGDEVGGS